MAMPLCTKGLAMTSVTRSGSSATAAIGTAFHGANASTPTRPSGQM
ncbi:hypothetical protein PF010_g11315 [Phytophthora fragariae]|uniref:Uncharacterized protein n=1 Tax=Phytophthora fragariae TaxID=53985 RepID=A0A6G0L6X3_9STRA|nr:hypothetical protein PF010_g11315 [Phytophthora fragariae]